MSNDGKGWKFPETDSQFTTCIEFAVPSNPEYIAAALGALTELTKWWNWEKTGDRRGADTAEMMRRLILSTFQTVPCSGQAKESFQFWGWDVRFSQTASWFSSAFLREQTWLGGASWVSGQGYVSTCNEEGLVKGTAMKLAGLQAAISGELLLEIAGAGEGDRIYVSGTFYELGQSAGLLPQWISIGDVLISPDDPVIEFYKDGCDPDTYPRISRIGVRSFLAPYKAVRGVYPL